MVARRLYPESGNAERGFGAQKGKDCNYGLAVCLNKDRRYSRPGGDAAQADSPERYLAGVDDWIRVDRIERRRGPLEVFNLEVEDDPTYIANGIIAHNCRALDGTIISVNDCSDLIERGANVEQPEDIKTVNPFINTRRDPDNPGGKILRTANGVKIATVHRSGYGVRDDRGQFSLHRSGQQLPQVGIGPPPYHHHCFDAQTEIMLSDGTFIPFAELRQHQWVWTLDPETIELEAQPADEIIAYPYRGEMILVETSMLSLYVTPDHRMMMWDGRVTECRAGEMPPAGSLLAYRNGIIYGAPYHGRQKTTVPYCGMVYCTNVARHHTLIVRREGKVAISGNCRSYTVPKTQLVQVPQGYMPRALPMRPPPPPRPVRAKPQPPKGFPRGMIPSGITPGVRSSERPYELVREPMANRPTRIGDQPRPPDDPYLSRGLVPGRPMPEQIQRRSEDAAKALTEALERTRRQLARALTVRETGGVLRKSVEEHLGGKIPELANTSANRAAALEALKLWATGQAWNMPGLGRMRPGAWGDIYCGLEPAAGQMPVLATRGRHAFRKGAEHLLAYLWGVNPQHIGFIMALMQGQFTPR